MKSLNGAAVVAAWSALAAGGAAHAQEAVQWRVEDGGNGHWYQCTDISGNWDELRAIAVSLGAELASLSSAAENQVAWDRVVAAHGSSGTAWIGARKLPGQPWEWSDTTPWGYVNWAPGEPCCFDNGLWVHLQGPSGAWQDHNQTTYPNPGLIEWSADCNGDGIVDYGQILDGTYADMNGNGVPDCCDKGVDCDPCVGDVNFDGIVNGADISVLLGFWGLSGKPNNADTNNDGQVDGTDLANVLGSWGECP